MKASQEVSKQTSFLTNTFSLILNTKMERDKKESTDNTEIIMSVLEATLSEPIGENTAVYSSFSKINMRKR